MPKIREGWDGPAINAQLDRVLNSLRQELFAKAWRPPNLLTDEYVADLMQRALRNRKWTPGETLHNPWRHEHI